MKVANTGVIKPIPLDQMGGVGADGYLTEDALAAMGDTYKGMKITPKQLESAFGMSAGQTETDTPWYSNMTGYEMVKGGLGVGQLGLGVASYLENAKTAKKQRELMDQQISSNRFLLNQAKGRQADISRDFGKGLGQTLVTN